MAVHGFSFYIHKIPCWLKIRSSKLEGETTRESPREPPTTATPKECLEYHIGIYMICKTMKLELFKWKQKTLNMYISDQVINYILYNFQKIVSGLRSTCITYQERILKKNILNYFKTVSIAGKNNYNTCISELYLTESTGSF